MTYTPIPKAQKPEADRPVVLEKRSFFLSILISNHFWKGQSLLATKPLSGNRNKYFINGVL
jgi:hypothetical protein